MVEKLQVGEKWYILATASPADERRRVLKHNDVFGMFDRYGDIQSIGLGEEGIYRGDTCFLSHHELLIEGVRPMFLNSTVRDDNGLLVVELMNPDLHPSGSDPIPKGEMHIFRAKLLLERTCYEHIRIANFGLQPVRTTLAMEFAADYKDIFEVRGHQRAQRGEYMQPRVGKDELLLGYKGRDDSQDAHPLRPAAGAPC
jgi:glycogen debranching enzyme